LTFTLCNGVILSVYLHTTARDNDDDMHDLLNSIVAVNFQGQLTAAENCGV